MLAEDILLKIRDRLIANSAFGIKTARKPKTKSNTFWVSKKKITNAQNVNDITWVKKYFSRDPRNLSTKQIDSGYLWIEKYGKCSLFDDQTVTRIKI